MSKQCCLSAVKNEKENQYLREKIKNHILKSMITQQYRSTLLKLLVHCLETFRSLLQNAKCCIHLIMFNRYLLRIL